MTTHRSTEVRTLSHGGAVAGRQIDDVVVFSGIPYAAPPFGADRLRAPRPVTPWEGVRDATRFGPTAPKGQYPAPVRRIMPEIEIPGEECLNLNIWTPADEAGETQAERPVLLYIHGGSFLNGSNSLPEYDGTAFARDGVVCVTINYRLGAEGFLHLPDTDTNRGLLDMIAALRWVREEIRAFGGDPGRVTLAGESAGAMAIGSLLAMPAARGLFSRAILHSGTGSTRLSLAEAERTAETFGEVLGLPATRAALADVPPERLVDAVEETFVRMQSVPDEPALAPVAPRFLPFAPVIDGDTLPRDPLAAVAESADVPVLVCTNRDEGRLFLVPSGAAETADDHTLEPAVALYGLTPAGLGIYRAGRPGGTPADIMSAVVGDRRFLLPAIDLAEGRARVGARTWLARFDAVAPEDNEGLGSCHDADVPFFFATIDEPTLAPRIGESPSRAASDVLHGAWVAFASTGDPGWPAYDLDTRATARFTDSVDVIDDLAAPERAAWAG